MRLLLNNGSAVWRPGVVVKRIAAHIHHAVNRARAAEGLAARDGDRAAVEVRFRLGGEPPIVARVVEEFREADEDVDPHRIVNGPASSSKSCALGFSVSLLASTQPAEPAPMMMES